MLIRKTEQTKSKANRRKKIININIEKNNYHGSPEKNKIENAKTVENQTKLSRFLEIIYLVRQASVSCSVVSHSL